MANKCIRKIIFWLGLLGPTLSVCVVPFFAYKLNTLPNSGVVSSSLTLIRVAFLILPIAPAILMTNKQPTRGWQWVSIFFFWLGIIIFNALISTIVVIVLGNLMRPV